MSGITQATQLMSFHFIYLSFHSVIQSPKQQVQDCFLLFIFAPIYPHFILLPMRDAEVERSGVLSLINVANNFVMSSGFSARVFYYPTLLWNVMLESKSRRWYDRIDSTVILGALPFKSQTRKLVEKENVRAVITLNEEYETRYFCNTAEEWSAWGVKQLRLATVDFNNAPPQEMLQKGVEFLEEMRSKGNTVYVHCKAGRGRSVTLVACYLMKKMAMTPLEAHSYIQSKRPHIRLGSRQWEAINEYYQQLKSTN